MKASGRKSANELLAVELARGQFVVDAAKAARVSEATVYRRVKEPAFAARVRELRGEMVSRAAGRLADSMAEAADVLRALLKSESEQIRLRAADLLNVHAVRLSELSELEGRVSEIERRLTPGHVEPWKVSRNGSVGGHA